MYLLDTTTNAVTQVSFAKAFGESGTYMPSFSSNGKVLLSSNYAGSGWVPLRQYDPISGTTNVLGSIRQSSMLTASADRGTIGIAEANEISAPLDRYNVGTGTIQQWSVDWFAFEMGVSRNGSQFAVPTYGGMYVYDNALHQVGIIGQYATNGPIGVVYSPNKDVMYTAWYNQTNSSRQIHEFSATTLQQIGTFDAYGSASGSFDWNGNGALNEGRLKISPDGNLLFATVDGGVSIIDVPEPSTAVLAGVAFGLVWVVRKRFK
jgi:hypothetical protein